MKLVNTFINSYELVTILPILQDVWRYLQLYEFDVLQ